MNGLDIVLAFLSVISFGAAFFIASSRVSKNKVSHQSWDITKSENSQTIDNLSSINKETQ